MESLGYILMYFVTGTLPWQGLRAATKQQKYERKLGDRLGLGIAPSYDINQICRHFRKEDDDPDRYSVQGCTHRVRHIPQLLPRHAVRGEARLQVNWAAAKVDLISLRHD